MELTFDGCEIDVLDEPVENPTMAHFEANGFRYTTFRLDPDGNVASNSYNLAAPFPTVNEETIEQTFARVEKQTSFELSRLLSRGGMTLVTILCQDGTNLFLE